MEVVPFFTWFSLCVLRCHPDSPGSMCTTKDGPKRGGDGTQSCEEDLLRISRKFWVEFTP